MWKPLLAGALGGLVGSGIKAAAEAVYPPRTAGQIPPPIVLVRNIAGRPLAPSREALAMQVIHYGFGALTGAAYAVLAERQPAVTIGWGAGFGLALNLLTHESALPLMGLSDAPVRQTRREQKSEALTHLLYGVATEFTRSRVRARLRS